MSVTAAKRAKRDLQSVVEQPQIKSKAIFQIHIQIILLSLNNDCKTRQRFSGSLLEMAYNHNEYQSIHWVQTYTLSLQEYCGQVLNISVQSRQNHTTITIPSIYDSKFILYTTISLCNFNC